MVQLYISNQGFPLRIRIIGILSFCTLMILGIAANLVSAQERTVGVSVGDTFEYGVSFSWNSSDPNATIPDVYRSASEMEWMSVAVVDISNTTVTIHDTMHFKNGTEATQHNILDVDTGNGNMTYWIVSANLDINDTLYTSSMYDYYRINETTVKTYPDGTRNTNHMNVTSEANMGVNYQYSSMNFYWDRSTGVMVESNMATISLLYGLESNMTAILTMTQSNLWVVPEFSAFAPLLTLMIIVAVAAVGNKGRLVKTEIG